MSLGLVALGKQTRSGFNDDIHATGLSTGAWPEVLDRADAFDLVAIDNNDVGFSERRIALFGGDVGVKPAVRCESYFNW